MSPGSKPNDHPVAIWWRRWAGAVALVAIVIGGAVGFVKLEAAQDDTATVAEANSVNAHKLAHIVSRLDAEGQVREEQFCQLVLSGYEDRLHRIETTEQFLNEPAGEEPTVFNEYIREISLPQTVIEVNKEREGLPDICWKYKPREVEGR